MKKLLILLAATLAIRADANQLSILFDNVTRSVAATNLVFTNPAVAGSLTLGGTARTNWPSGLTNNQSGVALSGTFTGNVISNAIATNSPGVSVLPGRVIIGTNYNVIGGQLRSDNNSITSDGAGNLTAQQITATLYFGSFIGNASTATSAASLSSSMSVTNLNTNGVAGATAGQVVAWNGTAFALSNPPAGGSGGGVTNNPAYGISVVMQTNGLPTTFDASGVVNSPMPGAIHQAALVAPFILSVQPYLGGGTANVFTNISQVTNTLNLLASAGILANLTNSTMPVEICHDVGALVPNADGSLGYKSYIFAPLGITNYISMLRTNYGFGAGFMRNAGVIGFVPTNVSGFFYATNANYLGNLLFQPYSSFDPQSWTNGWATNYIDVMFPAQVPNHILTLYSWGATHVWDNDFTFSTYDFDALEKTIAYNILHPYSVVFGYRHWNDPGFAFLDRLKNPMRFTGYESWASHPDMFMPDTYGYHNALQSDAPASTGLRWGNGSIAGNREFRRFKFYHPLVAFSNRGGSFEFQASGANDANLQAIAGWSPFRLMLGDTNQLISYVTLYTNAGWKRIHNDPLQNFPTVIYDATNTALVLAKTLVSGTVAVYLSNEGGSSTNLTVNWASVGLPQSTACNVLDVMSSNVVSSASGSFSTNLAAGTSCIIELVPQAPTSGLQTYGAGIVTNLYFAVTNNFVTTNSGASQLTQLTGNTGSGLTLYPGQYSFECRTFSWPSNGCTSGTYIQFGFSGSCTNVSFNYFVHRGTDTTFNNAGSLLNTTNIFFAGPSVNAGGAILQESGGFAVNDDMAAFGSLTVTSQGTFTMWCKGGSSAASPMVILPGTFIKFTQVK